MEENWKQILPMDQHYIQLNLIYQLFNNYKEQL